MLEREERMSLRDLTKSALSFSWALSLLGAKQAVTLIQPRRQNESNPLAPIAQVAANQIDESMKGIYRSGDSLQSAAVDVAFTWMNPVNWFNPNTWIRPFSGRSQPAVNSNATNCGCNQKDQNGFTRAAAGIGDVFNQATTGVASAIEQATTGITQAASGFTQAASAFTQAPSGSTQAASGSTGPSQATATQPASRGGTTPISNDSAASGWGPMPVDA